MSASGGHHHHNLASVFRTDSALSNSSHGGDLFLPQYSSYMEKRQLFLRSYQFSRKKTFRERLKSSLYRFRRVLCLRFRSARRLRRVVWTRLRSALFRRRRFSRLVYQQYRGGSRIRLGSRWPES